MLENRAQFSLEEGKTEAEAEVFQKDKNITWLHGTSDNPEAMADIVITDKMGNPQYTKKDVKFIHSRFGERIDLQLNDNQCIIKLENVRNAKKLDIFVE